MPVSPHEMELLARQVNHAHRAAIQAELNAVGLGEVGHPMLMSILQSSCHGAEEGCCHAQRELAQLLHISPAAVANSLKSLEKGGYIRREPGVGDARRNQVILTEKGAQAVAGCQQVFVRVSARMMAGFTPEEQELMFSFQRRMLQNLLQKEPETQRQEV